MVTAAGGLAAETTAGCSRQSPEAKADYTVRIGHSAVEVAPGQLVPTTTYNGQFPGPLLRFTEGKRTTVDIYNDTNTPEQLHWHGQQIPVDVDGSSEEGTRSSPRTACAESRLCRVGRGSASTTPTSPRVLT